MENLVGIVLPPIVEFCNKDVQSDEERFLVALFVCFLVSMVLKYQDIATGNINDLFSMFLLISGETIATFNLYWKNSFPRDYMQQKLGVGDTQSQ